MYIFIPLRPTPRSLPKNNVRSKVVGRYFVAINRGIYGVGRGRGSERVNRRSRNAYVGIYLYTAEIEEE